MRYLNSSINRTDLLVTNQLVLSHEHTSHKYSMTHRQTHLRCRTTHTPTHEHIPDPMSSLQGKVPHEHTKLPHQLSDDITLHHYYRDNKLTAATVNRSNTLVQYLQALALPYLF